MSSTIKKTIAIIGGGPASMLLACHLDFSKFDITIYERNNTLGRKFLVAGKGGFNLTHGEAKDQMKERYLPLGFMDKYLDHFDNKDLRQWLDKLGIPTFVGSSNRVFPIKGTKPIDVLEAIKKELARLKVQVKYNHTWIGFQKESNQLIILDRQNNEQLISSDITVFGLGGSSWSKTGSKGEWLPYFREKGIVTKSFLPSNCAFGVTWPPIFIEKNEGKPLKNIALICENKSIKGELTITQFGLEGSPIYALSHKIRASLKKGQTNVYLDLKPTLSSTEIQQKISKNIGIKSWSNFLKTSLKLDTCQMNLLKSYIDKDTFQDIKKLSSSIKRIPIPITMAGPLDEAISTVGGIDLKSINASMELVNLPNHYVIGEMLDWDAPTGGYLLQGCMSMGVTLGKQLNRL